MYSNSSIFAESLKPHPKILALGRNYKPAQASAEPIVFTKASTSVWIPQEHGGRYPLIPADRKLYHEIELGFMIGKGGKNISLENAMSHVGGYFLALDMTEFDYTVKLMQQGFPWDLGKSQDRFLPLSDFIPLERIENPHDLLLDLSINGKVIQHDTTNNMIHNIPRIIEFVSGFMTLNPGDLFLTGTPSGVGVLAVGDLLDARLIQKDHVLAQISLTVVAPQE